MAKIVQFQHPMRADIFEKNVKYRAKVSHMVFLPNHVKDQMLERKITIRQVLNTLRKGSLSGQPKRNEAQASYEGVMTYHGTGRKITVVCAIRQSELTIVAITVY